MIELGFASAIVPDLNFDAVIDKASEIGYSCVEVMCWPKGKAERRYAGISHIDMDTLNDEEISRIQEKCRAKGVSISALGYYPNPLDPDMDAAEQAVDHIKSVIRGSARLGIGKVNTFVGRDWTKSVEDNWPRFLSTWKDIISVAEEFKVQVGIENCPMFFTDDEWPGGKNLATTPVIWERMFNDIPSDYFGLNYDPSHFVWQQMDHEAPLRDFSEKIFHVHAKDVRVDRHSLNRVGIMANPLEYHTPKLPGAGEINWGRFFSILGDTGYDGPVCVEVEDRVFEGSDAARIKSLELSYRYLKNFIA
ncbi:MULTISPECIES: sugar phosphate isomerase/epimerase [unclassified Oceanispirochaeta]|uniref:sugar phosphate isomerase/epimerase family protein n=1 Tax=unclassified Oceanispirochaeta TaxID=2635722 RepID=UPI000E0940C2|nr:MULTISPECIES: sugar phosphate isomerase/epimerase family protein [unclassified Oceanispirochaeta]NPD74013.1 sugar phosphate isomerase/epimerase [Oceanispirochaeta sp. M1]RDG30184.1 sugar phosphate isomerase/epimerase [Oceanispirochaeta sp. M1]